MIHEKYSSRCGESNGIGRITLRMVMKRRGTETGKRNKMGKDFVFSCYECRGRRWWDI
jgi:hypothetical protein